MQKVLLSLFFSTILLITGCFSDADSAINSWLTELESLEYVDGKFSSNGFIQLNSFRNINNLRSKVTALNDSKSFELESKINVIHNTFSNVYSYFVSFGKINPDANSIKIELLKKNETFKSFDFEIAESDTNNNLLDVREPGESANFQFTNTGFIGSDVSTQPNILIRFMVPVSPMQYVIKMISITKGTEIPISVEYTKNPTLLIFVKQKLNNNDLYRIEFEQKDSGQSFEILFVTKSINEIFQTLTLEDKYLELVTSSFMLGLSANLEVRKIVEFEDTVISATQGAYFFPEVFNFVVMTSDRTLKLVDDFNLIKIEGEINLSSIAGITSADIDNDGLDELLVYNNFGRIDVYKISSSLELIHYDKYDLYRSSDLMMTFSIADIDNNGYFDFIAGYASGIVNCLYRDEFEQNYKLKTIENHDSPVNSIGISDFNRDSLLDIAILDKSGFVSVWTNHISSWQRLYTSELNDISKFYIHDLNHDGFDDMIASSNKGNLIYFANYMNSFEAKILNSGNQYFDDVNFAAGFTQNNIYELMIYRPVLNLIRTFSLEGYFHDVELNTNKESIVELQPSEIELNSLPNRIVSFDFNNDRLMDILVVTEDSLTIYLQKFDNSTETNAFSRKYNMSSIAPENIVIAELNNDACKELIFSEANRIIIVSTETYDDRTLEIELNTDEDIVELSHFKYNTLDYLAILTTRTLIVGLLEFNNTLEEYTFKKIQTQQILGNHIEIIDFNSDNLPDALIRSDSNSLLMFSQMPDDELTFFQHIVDFPLLYTVENGDYKNSTVAAIKENHIQLYEYTDQGIFIEKLPITQANITNSQSRILKNDIDHDGIEDIVLMRTNGVKLIIDVLTYDSVAKYKHDPVLSTKFTELVNSGNLKYVGLVDLDSDSWIDIVFCDENQKLFTLKVK